MNRLIVSIIIIILSIASVFVGVVGIELDSILQGDSHALLILFVSRLPRLTAVLITGIALSVAGLIMQQLARNKYVSPQTGATIFSAQLGFIIAMVYFNEAGKKMEIGLAFLFAMIGTTIFMIMVQRTKFKNVIYIPLIGMMLGNVISAVTEFISYRYNIVQNLKDWSAGNFSLILKGNYETLYICLPLVIIAFIYANYFNIAGMGDDFAKNLGVNYKLVLYSGLGIASLLTAGVVVTVGSIPFVGLIVPNLVSILKGDRMKMTLIDTALLGAMFLIVCDIVGRLIIFPYELPIGLTVGVVGSGIFLLMIWRREVKRAA